jgi:UDP-N-acetylglucosamine 3-dehydrogenase
VGVARDLATHDLDIVRYILGSEVTHLYCQTRTGVRTQYEDAILALLRFENEVSASLDVNWLSPIKVRELTILAEGGMLTLDYINQELFLYQDVSQPSGWVDPAALRVSAEAVNKLPVRKKEPLLAELEAFVDAVWRNQPPALSCDDAVVALHLAEKLVQSGEERRGISVASPVAGGRDR